MYNRLFFIALGMFIIFSTACRPDGREDPTHISSCNNQLGNYIKMTFDSLNLETTAEHGNGSAFVSIGRISRNGETFSIYSIIAKDESGNSYGFDVILKTISDTGGTFDPTDFRAFTFFVGNTGGSLDLNLTIDIEQAEEPQTLGDVTVYSKSRGTFSGTGKHFDLNTQEEKQISFSGSFCRDVE
ncbi:MAG: hypothetical protein D6730_10240 [Bacteroidetes bacterium]|nr:MAG: hypothetical protein D6730_10240 [Bacteroidota bacterium]